MTPLERVLTRKTPSLVIQIAPGDEARKLPAMIRLREVGRRTWFGMPLGAVYVEAVRRSIEGRRGRKRVSRGLVETGRRR